MFLLLQLATVNLIIINFLKETRDKATSEVKWTVSLYLSSSEFSLNAFKLFKQTQVDELYYTEFSNISIFHKVFNSQFKQVTNISIIYKMRFSLRDTKDITGKHVFASNLRTDLL